MFLVRFLLLPLFFISSACQAKVSEEQIKTWRDLYKTPGMVVGLDVRTSLELKLNPAPGAQHQGFMNLEPFIKKADKNKVVFVFCESGGRAGKAKKNLEKAGFKSVINIGDWRTWNQITTKVKK